MYFDTCETLIFYRSDSYQFDIGIHTYNDCKEAIPLLVGENEKTYNVKNYKKLSLEDISEAFKKLLKTDIATDEGLLSFVSEYGLPSSDAYTSQPPSENFYFEEFYAQYCSEEEMSTLRKTITSPEPAIFIDLCSVEQARNSLLTFKDLVVLKYFLEKEDEAEKNLLSVFRTFSMLLVHFKYIDLFNNLESDNIYPKTDTVSLIQDIFVPCKEKFPASYKKMLHNMLSSNCGPEFNRKYNTEKGRNIFKIIKTLYDILTDDNIQKDKNKPVTLIHFLENAESNFSEFEHIIRKHLNLNKIKCTDLYNVAQCLFDDLVFEAFSTSAPLRQKKENTIAYVMKITTPLQALYFHLYQFDGILKRCPQCKALFQTTKKNKSYCSEECRNRANSKKSYDRKKQSGCKKKDS